MDLAKHLSAILKSERVPHLAGVIIDELEKENPSMTHFTVENLSKFLCEEGAENET